MRKFLLIFAILFLGNFAFADDAVLSGGITFDWVNMEQVQRDEAIDSYKNIIFADGENSNFKRREFKDKYKDYLKDKNYKTHYRLSNAGVTETSEAKLCAFYTKDRKILYMYALQFNDRPNRVFYYDVLGHLRYIDEMSDSYPDFPYHSKQYRETGRLVSAIYFTDKDTQYMYEPDGTFKGVWYKDKMFDNKAKLIFTRTNW